MTTFSSNPHWFALASTVLVLLGSCVSLSTSWYSFEQAADEPNKSQLQYTIYFSLWGVSQYNNTITSSGATYSVITASLTWQDSGFLHLHSLYQFSAAMIVLAFIFDLVMAGYLTMIQILPAEYSTSPFVSFLVVHQTKFNKALIALQGAFVFTALLATFVFLRHPVVAAEDYLAHTGQPCTVDMCAGFIGSSPTMHYGPTVGWSTSLLLILFRAICVIFYVMIVRKPPVVKVDYETIAQ